MNRPLGVTILGWMFVTFSVRNGISLILSFLNLDLASLEVHERSLLIARYVGGESRCISEFIVGIFLLKLRPWARIAAMIFAVFGGITNGYTFAVGYERGGQPSILALLIGYGLSLTVACMIVVYLLKKNVREAFRHGPVQTEVAKVGFRKTNVLWKIYFWFLLLPAIPTFLWVGFSRLWEVIDLIVVTISTVGLFGFCWRKKIITRLFWKFYFLVPLIWQFIYQFIIPLHPKAQGITNAPAQVVGNTIGLALLGPLFYALYLYGFKRNELWDTSESAHVKE